MFGFGYLRVGFVFLCMCVCVCVYMCVCVYCMRVCVYMCVSYVCMCLCVLYARVCVYMYVCVRTRVVGFSVRQVQDVLIEGICWEQRLVEFFDSVLLLFRGGCSIFYVRRFFRLFVVWSVRYFWMLFVQDEQWKCRDGQQGMLVGISGYAFRLGGFIDFGSR